MRLGSQRLAELRQPNTCYVIDSNFPDYEEPMTTGCEAGFFSLFLRALYGIRLAERYRLPYHVDYGSISYLYSDPENFQGDSNLWNYYFQQPFPHPPTGRKLIQGAQYETFPLRIWNRSFIQEMHRIIQTHIKLQPAVQQKIREKKKVFDQTSVLGVHIRRTDHYLEVEPVPLKIFKDTINKELSQYEKIFIATDDASTLNVLIEEFGDRIIYNDVKRSLDGTPVHLNHLRVDNYALGMDALLDAYSLSFCQKAILVYSNFSYASLLLNPSLPYTLLETRKDRRRRWRTTLAYYLDRFITHLPKHD